MKAATDRHLWEADATRHGGRTSMGVLLDWLRHDGNYERWRSGKKTGGHTKESLLREILAEMQHEGISHRSTRDLRSKLNDLERSLRSAVEWNTKYGEKMLRERGEAHGNAEIQASMVKICKYFHELAPVMLPKIQAAPMTTLATAAGTKRAAFASNGNAHRCGHDEEENESRGHSEEEEEEEEEDEDDNDEERDEQDGGTVERSGAYPSAYVQARSEFVPIQPRPLPAAEPQLVSRRLSQGHHKRQKLHDLADASSGVKGLTRQLQMDRLHHESRCLVLEEEKLRLEVQRQHIQVTKEKAVARLELRQAGVPDAEIDKLFPLQ